MRIRAQPYYSPNSDWKKRTAICSIVFMTFWTRRVAAKKVRDAPWILAAVFFLRRATLVSKLCAHCAAMENPILLVGSDKVAMRSWTQPDSIARF